MSRWDHGGTASARVARRESAGYGHTAGLKANAKQAADLWRGKEGTKFLISRGGFNMLEETNRQLLLVVLDKVVDVSEAITKQLETMSEFESSHGRGAANVSEFLT